MKKLILASVSGIALMGLAACSDTDNTTTQALPEDQAPITEPAPGAAPTDPAPVQPAPPADAPAD